MKGKLASLGAPNYEATFSARIPHALVITALLIVALHYRGPLFLEA